MRPNPCRMMLWPCLRDTSWALLRLAAAASVATAKSLLLAAAVAPSPKRQSLSSRSRACCLTAWRESCRLRSATKAAFFAVLDIGLPLGAGVVSRRSSRDLASLCTSEWTSSLVIFDVRCWIFDVWYKRNLKHSWHNKGEVIFLWILICVWTI